MVTLVTSLDPGPAGLLRNKNGMQRNAINIGYDRPLECGIRPTPETAPPLDRVATKMTDKVIIIARSPL